MKTKKNPNFAYLVIILGVALLLFFASSILLPIIAILGAALLINYGLELLGQPPLLVFLQRLIDEIRHKFRR